jgi:hypothetical protein
VHHFDPMLRRLAVLVALFTFGASVAYATATYDVTTDAPIRATVLFVGDSNITYGGAAITTELTTRANGYLPVLASRIGTGIRGYGSNTCSGCAASDYWKIHLADALADVTPAAIVTDLGINDALVSGTETSVGYSFYAQKIDWLMALLPNRPVLWSTLPCSLEPSAYRTGCTVINNAIVAAPARHANLTIVPWYKAAVGHPEYMGGPGTAPHYTAAGYAAWSKLVRATLAGKLPA